MIACQTLHLCFFSQTQVSLDQRLGGRQPVKAQGGEPKDCCAGQAWAQAHDNVWQVDVAGRVDVVGTVDIVWGRG